MNSVNAFYTFDRQININCHDSQLNFEATNLMLHNNVIYILNVNVTTCRVNDVNTMTANAMKSRSNKSYYTSSIVHENESQVKMLPIS